MYSCLLPFLHLNDVLDHIFDLYLSQSDVPQIWENLPPHSLDLVERHLCRSRPRRVLCHSLNHQVQGKEGEWQIVWMMTAQLQNPFQERWSVGNQGQGRETRGLDTFPGQVCANNQPEIGVRWFHPMFQDNSDHLANLLSDDRCTLFPHLRLVVRQY